MLNYTFCGMGGLGSGAEQRLWNDGVLCWDDYLRLRHSPFSAAKHSRILQDLNEAKSELSRSDSGLRWFFKKIPVSHHCRLFPHLRDRCVYLDIETTGLTRSDVITVLSLFDGRQCRTFVRNRDLDESCKAVAPDSVFVTYNGRHFDIPFMRREFGHVFRQPNMDLRYILKGWGITGGLKHSMRVLGLTRTEAPSMESGLEAIELWRQSERGDAVALDALCRYNRDDVYGLEKILKLLYNTSMRNHPFHRKI